MISARRSAIPGVGGWRRAPQASSRLSWVLLVQASATITVWLAWKATQAYPDQEALVSAWCWVLTVLLVVCVLSWRTVTARSFDPYTLFLVSAFLFNGGQCLLETVGWNEHGLLEGRFPADLLTETIASVALALASFHLGALLAVRRGLGGVAARPVADSDGTIRAVGWAFVALSAGPLFLTLSQQISTASEGGYVALYQRETVTGLAAWPQLLAGFAVPGSMFLVAGGGKRPGALIPAVVAMTVLTVGYLFIGYRATALMPAVAFAWLWDRRVKRIPRPLIAVTAGACLLVLPVETPPDTAYATAVCTPSG